MPPAHSQSLLRSSALFSLILTLPTASLAAPPDALVVATEPASRPTAEPDEPPRSARDHYYEGEARYSAADYVGAIDSFTRALAAVTKEGATPRMRSSLLLNLAGAHVKAFEASPSKHHLVAADEIYSRLVHESTTTEYPSEHVDEAKRRSATVKDLLATHTEDDTTKAPPDTVTAVPAVDGPSTTSDHRAAPSDQNDRRRPWLAVTIGGATLAAGGLGVLIYGTQLRPLAEKRAHDEGRDDDEAQKYIDKWTANGRIAMGVGGAATAVGVAALTTGIVFLVRGEHRSGSEHTLVVPVLMPRHVGVNVAARF